MHPIPVKYHSIFHIGEEDRRGNIIDFKIPPIILDSPVSIVEYRGAIFDGHIKPEQLPLVYIDVQSFIILRPSALPYKLFIREKLVESGFEIKEEFELGNFMQFADIVYVLDPDVSFHWKWRTIMHVLHDTNTQDQNRAVVFLLGNPETNRSLTGVKQSIRADMGETPVLVRYNGIDEIALGIHHLHSPDLEKISIEYNVLMHARYKTSVFS